MAVMTACGVRDAVGPAGGAAGGGHPRLHHRAGGRGCPHLPRQLGWRRSRLCQFLPPYRHAARLAAGPLSLSRRFLDHVRDPWRAVSARGRPLRLRTLRRAGAGAGETLGRGRRNPLQWRLTAVTFLPPDSLLVNKPTIELLGAIAVIL